LTFLNYMMFSLLRCFQMEKKMREKAPEKLLACTTAYCTASMAL